MEFDDENIAKKVEREIENIKQFCEEIPKQKEEEYIRIHKLFYRYPGKTIDEIEDIEKRKVDRKIYDEYLFLKPKIMNFDYPSD